MSGARSPAAIAREREAQKKWHKENIERLTIGLPKGMRARYRLIAQRRGISVAALIKYHLNREFLKEVSVVKIIGKWWNDASIDLVELDGTVYALNGWNGEVFTECWECFGDFFNEAGEKSYTLQPIYRFQAENIALGSLEENSPEWDAAVEVVDYEVSPN